MNKLHVHQSDNAGLLLLGAGQTADGKPTHRYVKDLISVGTYTHPTKKWNLEVTPDRLQKWATRFNSARAAGVDFEVTVDHSQKAGDVLGYLTEMRVEGNRLMGVHEFADDAGAAIASRCKNVSVEIDPDLVDGKGNHYGEAITKSSLVQQPVVPGQSPFEKMAASRGGEPGDEAQHLWLATTLEPPMNFTILSDAIGKTVTDEASLTAAIKELKTKAEPAPAAPATDPATLSRIAALEAQNHKLARAGIVAEANTILASLKGVVPAANLEKHAPAFLDAVAGTDAAPSKLCLSMTEGTPAPASKILSVMGDLLKGIAPAVQTTPGVKTPGQGGDPVKTSADETDDIIKASAARAGLTLAK